MEPKYFFIIWITAFGGMMIYTIYSSRKALKIYPPENTVNIKFKEKGASGCSNDSFITKAGGASGVLHVIVTDQELWTKTGIFFAWAAKMYKLLHKIPLTNVVRTNVINERKVEVHFLDHKDRNRSLTLKLKNVQGFVQAVGK